MGIVQHLQMEGFFRARRAPHLLNWHRIKQTFKLLTNQLWKWKSVFSAVDTSSMLTVSQKSQRAKRNYLCKRQEEELLVRHVETRKVQLVVVHFGPVSESMKRRFQTPIVSNVLSCVTRLCHYANEIAETCLTYLESACRSAIDRCNWTTSTARRGTRSSFGTDWSCHCSTTAPNRRPGRTPCPGRRKRESTRGPSPRPLPRNSVHSGKWCRKMAAAKSQLETRFDSCSACSTRSLSTESFPTCK